MTRTNSPRINSHLLSRRLLLPGLALIACALIAAALLVAYREINRTPGELLRYAQKRLSGHTKLETILLPPLLWARNQVERKVEGLPPPLQLRGVEAGSLPLQRYDANGHPIANSPGIPLPQPTTLHLSNEATLVTALKNARPGDVIELLPGHYVIKQDIRLSRGGTATAPITLRAARPGSVRIDLRTTEGFVVAEPYWIFENLHLVGTCTNHSQCEHAFHVVGNAQSTVIRNNVLQDFNAAIKVNGSHSRYPDHGLIQHNHIFNTAIRNTRLPVVGIDIVAASGWQVADNLVADLHTPNQQAPSYGIYMKGGGRGGRIERNLVVCQLTLQNSPGTRVGISIGGGRTGPAYLRSPDAQSEHDDALVANNMVAHCNDFGIDVNASTNARIAFNTAINTYGIDIRNAPASAAVYGNLVEGHIRARNGGWLAGQANLQGSATGMFANPDRLDLRLLSLPASIARLEAITDDFCSQPRQDQTYPGAFGPTSSCSPLSTTPLQPMHQNPAE